MCCYHKYFSTYIQARMFSMITVTGACIGSFFVVASYFGSFGNSYRKIYIFAVDSSVNVMLK
jgi:hypothetical protein